MTLNLQKGQRISLTKDNPNLKRLNVCLGWDVNKTVGGADFDPDASAILLTAKGKVISEKDVIFYNMVKTDNKLIHFSGAVTHSGDNRTGAGIGDKEVIAVDLSKVPTEYAKISFIITIYEAKQRKQNFSMMENSFVRVVDADTNTEIIRFNLGEDFSIETGVITGEVYRYENNWKFAAIGSGFAGGLEEILKQYGLG